MPRGILQVGLVLEGKSRLGIDESADQPGGCHPVDKGPPAGQPGHAGKIVDCPAAWQVSRGAALVPFFGGSQFFQLFAKRTELCCQVLPQIRLEEITLLNRLEFIVDFLVLAEQGGRFPVPATLAQIADTAGVVIDLPGDFLVLGAPLLVEQG